MDSQNYRTNVLEPLASLRDRGGPWASAIELFAKSSPGRMLVGHGACAADSPRDPCSVNSVFRVLHCQPTFAPSCTCPLENPNP